MSNKQRSVKLFCPLVSKAAWLVVWDEQRLDLGSIARTFGLDPSTLKLNGHFISRGVDFIASSVTWNSLISFFSARGFPTGKNHQDALIVDGKLTKLGSKSKLFFSFLFTFKGFLRVYGRMKEKLEFIIFAWLFF